MKRTTRSAGAANSEIQRLFTARPSPITKRVTPHIQRVASEAIRPPQNQLWRGLPWNRALTCALEQNTRRGNKAHPAGENENGCREAKPSGKHERQWHSLTLNNHSQKNRPQKNQSRRQSHPCTVLLPTS